MINPDNPRFVVWGFKDHYCTHQHIHAAFERTLRLTGKQVLWLDRSDDLSRYDLSDTMFITEHRAALDGMPIRDDCFYVVHGLNDDPEARARFASHPNRLSWNVYHDYSHVYGTQGNPVNDHVIGVPLTDVMWIAEEVPLYPKERHLDFRWATDLVPEEIERNKPEKILNKGKVINYVGTQWWVNLRELTQFKKACEEDGVELRFTGAGQNGVVSIEDNVRLIRESCIAPAIVGSHHITEGYAPCRIFKNISYGQYGVTNSLRVYQLLGMMPIYNPDPYQLYFEARDRLMTLDVKHLHNLMDLVARKHTYVNRINAILKAARIIMEKP